MGASATFIYQHYSHTTFEDVASKLVGRRARAGATGLPIVIYMLSRIVRYGVLVGLQPTNTTTEESHEQCQESET